MLKAKLIDLGPAIERNEERLGRAIQSVISSTDFILGDSVRSFEAAIAERVGREYCVSVGSGTDALMIALMSLNIGRGDEVITTPFTFVSTVEVIVRIGAIPIFVDVDPQTALMDFDNVFEALTPRTRAVIGVSLFGQMADWQTLEHRVRAVYPNVCFIEDAAQSFGATFGTHSSCGVGTVGCTSFFPTKPLGCFGDGGAIFTDRSDIYHTCASLRNHGRIGQYTYDMVGFCSRLDSIQAAILIEKLKVFDDELESRRCLAATYRKSLEPANVQSLTVVDYATSAFAQYCILVDQQALFRAKMKENYGIPTGIYYPSLIYDELPYRDFAPSVDCAAARELSTSIVALPFYAFMPKTYLDRVVTATVQTLQEIYGI